MRGPAAFSRFKTLVAASLVVVACSNSDETKPPSTASVGAGAAGGAGGAGVGAGGAGGVAGGPVELIHYGGRFDLTDPAAPAFQWSGTSIGVRFSGTALDVDLDGFANTHFQVVVDGKPTGILVTEGGPKTYPVAMGLTDGLHDAEIFRRNEAFQGTIEFVGFKPGAGGKLIESPSPYAHKIEFIGDSITTGYGIDGTDPCSRTPDVQNAYLTYAAIAARNTKADAHLIAWSGKGLAKNCCGDETERMPELWLRTLPQLDTSKWDFATWTADAVVINLGSNDFNASVDEASFEAAYVALLQAIRSYYPAAPIFCVAGDFLDHGGMPTTFIQKAIDTLGDTNVQLLPLPGPDPADGNGCDFHPSAATHAKLGELLTDVLKQKLGW